MDLTLDRAVAFVSDETADYAGRMLAPVGDLQLGAGLIYAGITFPMFDSSQKRFVAQEGEVLVLTHECDIEKGNDKVFNSDVMIAPLAQLEYVFRELVAKRSPAEVKAYLGDLVHGRVSQLFYLPPWAEWPKGAVVLLNRIGHTHRTEFEAKNVKALAALTAYGYERLGYALHGHFLRPKEDRLPLTQVISSFSSLLKQG